MARGTETVSTEKSRTPSTSGVPCMETVTEKPASPKAASPTEGPAVSLIPS